MLKNKPNKISKYTDKNKINIYNKNNIFFKKIGLKILIYSRLPFIKCLRFHIKNFKN